MARLPKLAVWKFASCDGCQLSLLNCEDELLTLAGRLTIASFAEATRTVLPGPYDLSLVEGSITTEHDAERIREVRRVSRHVVTIGACATSGGIQALRNYADVAAYGSIVYPNPEYLSTLDRSTPIADHIEVDLELRGCPVDRGQLVEVVAAFLQGRRPRIPQHSVCLDCKQRGLVCVAVADGAACLGPVTQSGCGALCPAFSRGCFGCFGPLPSAGGGRPNTLALAARLRADGAGDDELLRLFRGINAGSAAFGEQSRRHEPEPGSPRPAEVTG
jgi:sulfhydrogenase subunit delta